VAARAASLRMQPGVAPLVLMRHRATALDRRRCFRSRWRWYSLA
jgi:hypothetical protein